MFCRFGSLLLRRPVAATAWLNDVCTRPVAGSTSCGSASMYVPFSFCSARHSSTSRGSSCVSASSSSTSTAVETALVLPVRLTDRQLQFVEEDVRQLLRRVDVELDAGQLEDPGASQRAARARSAATARRAPDRRRGCRRCSMPTSTGTSGSSSSRIHARRGRSRSMRRLQRVGQLQREVRALAREGQHRGQRQLTPSVAAFAPLPQTSSSLSAL